MLIESKNNIELSNTMVLKIRLLKTIRHTEHSY